MAKEDVIVFDGIVIESLPNTLFQVKCNANTDNEFIVLSTISGRMRKNNIRVLLGDKVQVEISPYDTTKGRITYRFK